MSNIDPKPCEFKGSTAPALGHEASGLGSANDNTPKPILLPELAPVLEEMTDIYRRLVVFEEDFGAEAVTMWLCHNRAFKAAEFNPIFISTNEEEGAGKTRLLKCVLAAANSPKPGSNPSMASIYRTKAGQTRTFIIDEADTGMFDRKEVAGLINAAWTKEFAQTGRAGSQEKDFASEDLSFWHPFAFGMIGLGLSPATKRRCWILRTRKVNRRSPEYTSIPKRGKERALIARLKELGQKLHTLLKPHIDYLRDAEPVIPDEIEDGSVEDNVTLMLAVAEMAGPKWAERARQVAVLMSNPARYASNEALDALDVAMGWFDEHPAVDMIPTKDWYAKCIDGGLFQKHEVSLRRFTDTLKPLRPDRKKGRFGRSARGRGFWKKDIEAVLEERGSLPPLEAEEDKSKDMVLPLRRIA